MNSVIRIAQIIGPAVNGGTEAFVMNYYKFMDHSKFEFDFFVENESEIVNQKELSKYGNGKIVIIPSYKKVFEYKKALTSAFKQGKYDIVHSNMNALSFFSLKAAKRARIEIRIAHSHSTSNFKEKKRNLIKLFLRSFSRVYPTHYFACSNIAGRWLFGKRLANSGQIHLIKNAIDLSRFQFDEAKRIKLRSELNISKSTMVIGTVGRLVKQKNPFFSLKVFKDYQETNPNSVLLFVGEGDLKRVLLKKAQKEGILNKVFFIDPSNEPEKYYFSMDIFLFPSLYEGLGISFVEAQATGLFCLGSSNIPKEAIVLPSTKLVRTDNTDSWIRLFPKTNSYSRLQDTGSFVKNHYSIQMEVLNLQTQYSNFINQRKKHGNH